VHWVSYTHISRLLPSCVQHWQKALGYGLFLTTGYYLHNPGYCLYIPQKLLLILYRSVLAATGLLISSIQPCSATVTLALLCYST